MKRNPKGSTSEKRASPPRTPTISSWSLGQPFIITRKNSSPHWEHFLQGDVVDTAKCLYCGVVVSCQTKFGTGTLQNHVERWKGFHQFCMDKCPQFTIPSRFTAARDFFLTTDSWTSGQNLGYMCLAVHLVDDECNLNKRIINFCQIPGHTGKVIRKIFEECLSEWDLKNILTVMVDNASSNDVFSVMSLMENVCICVAHILNLVIRHELAKSIEKIRTLVKYVRPSSARMQKFVVCMVEEKLDSINLVCLGVETRCNSTYFMLEAALKFKKAIGCLIVKDFMLQNEIRKVSDYLTNDEWKHVSYFLPFLKIFYDVTLKISVSCYVTSNSYVEVIYGVGEVFSQHLLHEEFKFAFIFYFQKKTKMVRRSILVHFWKNTELEKYLEDARESREPSFNILQWWKDNQRRYHILVKMARDVLDIPVSTVASESAFSMGGKVLDSFRTSLSPRMIKTLICAQDWLQTSRTPLTIEERLLEIEKIEEELILEQSMIMIDEVDG
ncbi:hypothetical protein RND81_06G085700 [Saponaria officinalis]|uniref:HAT C-terminal dimerisation domain-containing protein n=1 Tax=Saponaria officinalis TaxID=3572 RepID=A0AAW1K9D3_SAPOF